MSSKGGAYEREMCRTLSLWWTKGKNDDVFWRTSGSGGRATVRNKKGKRTFGQVGDVQATDPIGQPLIDLITIEIKRGYSDNSCADALDKKAPKKQPKKPAASWAQFVKQAREQSETANTPYWMLIQRRDRREPIVFLPWSLYHRLVIKTDCHLNGARPWLKLITLDGIRVFCTRLDEFLNAVSPQDIKKLKKPKIIIKRAKG